MKAHFVSHIGGRYENRLLKAIAKTFPNHRFYCSTAKKGVELNFGKIEADLFHKTQKWQHPWESKNWMIGKIGSHFDERQLSFYESKTFGEVILKAKRVSAANDVIFFPWASGLDYPFLGILENGPLAAENVIQVLKDIISEGKMLEILTRDFKDAERFLDSCRIFIFEEPPLARGEAVLRLPLAVGKRFVLCAQEHVKNSRIAVIGKMIEQYSWKPLVSEQQEFGLYELAGTNAYLELTSIKFGGVYIFSAVNPELVGSKISDFLQSFEPSLFGVLAECLGPTGWLYSPNHSHPDLEHGLFISGDEEGASSFLQSLGMQGNRLVSCM